MADFVNVMTGKEASEKIIAEARDKHAAVGAEKVFTSNPRYDKPEDLHVDYTKMKAYLVGKEVSADVIDTVMPIVPHIAQTIGKARLDAEARGFDTETAWKAGLQAGAMSLVGELTGGPLARKLKSNDKAKLNVFVKTILNATIRSSIEGATSATAKFAENVLAKWTYDPQRDYNKEVSRAAETGARRGFLRP